MATYGLHAGHAIRNLRFARALLTSGMPDCSAPTPLDDLWRAGGRRIGQTGDAKTCGSCNRASTTYRESLG